MDFTFDLGTRLQALLCAVAGMPFFMFCILVARGSGKPGTRLYSSLFFKSPAYRWLFRFHRRPVVMAATLTLAGYFLVGAWKLVDERPGHYDLPLLAYPAWFLLLLAFGGQGMTVALDRRLSFSWDLDDSLALHLTPRKLKGLSSGFAGLLGRAVVEHRQKLMSLGIDNALTLESWLLAPQPNRHVPKVKAFQRLLRLKRLKKLYPSSRSCYFERMKRCSITLRRIRRLMKGCRAKPTSSTPRRPVRMFHLLRGLVAAQKTVAVLLAATSLLLRSPLIYWFLHRLPMPVFNSGLKLSDGSPTTRLCQATEQQLRALAPTWSVTGLALKRMNMLTIILLVASHPSVGASLSGWVGGMKVR